MKTILLVICLAGLGLAQNKNGAAKTAPAAKPASSGPVSIPKDAVEIEKGLFQAKDETGKVWHYTRTPFGVRKFEPEHLKDDTAEEAARLTVTGEDGDMVKFVRKTPFGTAGWSRKKDKLNAAEKMAFERAARQSKDGAATATAAKPAI